MSSQVCVSRRFSRHLIGCLVAALVLMLSPGAFATTLVPMCGERAETIAAPPPMRGAVDTSISAPCNAPAELALDPMAPSRAPDLAAPQESAPRLPPLYYRLPRRPGAALGIAEAKLGGERPGFSRGLDRPPR
jgi:hypothetical protein